ncbi:hypothetical protein [Flindersiella endophytica]
MSTGDHIAKLDALVGVIREVNATALPPLVTDHNDTMKRLLQLQADLASARANANTMDGDRELNKQVQLQVKAGEEIVRLERIDQDGKGVMNGLGVAFEDAARAVVDAMKDHNLGDAPAAGEAPTDPNRTPRAPGGPGGPSSPGGTPPGGGPQPDQQQQQPGGGEQQPTGGGGGEQPPGGGAGDPTAPGGDTGLPDTGLSSAPPSTLPPSTVPDLPTTTPPGSPNLPGSSTPGSTGPLGGIGGGPLAAGLGGSSRPGSGTGANTPNVQQAARNLSSPQGAGTGQAPALGRLAAGSAGQAGSGAGGVPPMMPPMMPQTGAGTGKPKPGTAPATGTGRNRSAGGSAGVPAGLRGRTGGGGDGQRRPAVRRARQEAEQTEASQPNQNVELLDSELWEVDQPSPVTERRRVREY